MTDNRSGHTMASITSETIDSIRAHYTIGHFTREEAIERLRVAGFAQMSEERAAERLDEPIDPALVREYTGRVLTANVSDLDGWDDADDCTDLWHLDQGPAAGDDACPSCGQPVVGGDEGVVWPDDVFLPAEPKPSNGDDRRVSL